jgi:hypothetical protein
VLILSVFFLAACTHIAPFNQHAYEQATSLKVEAMTLVEKANDPYTKHEKEIEEFKLRMLKAYEYVKGIPKNVETSDQWAILISEKGKSVFGFLKFWQEKTTVSETFAAEYKKEIEKHFNKIIELEAGKIGSDK